MHETLHGAGVLQSFHGALPSQCICKYPHVDRCLSSSLYLQVVGDGHGFTQSGGVVFGYGNQLLANGASILGGSGNTGSGLYSEISGGRKNTAYGFASAISGGVSRIEYGQCSLRSQINAYILPMGPWGLMQTPYMCMHVLQHVFPPILSFTSRSTH